MRFIKALMLGKISKDDFLKKKRIRNIGAHVKKGLLAANKKENAEKADIFIYLIFRYKLYYDEYLEILNQMLIADWHYQHENIAMLLQKMKSPSSVDYLYKEILIQRKYLDYNDNESKIVKCLYALGDIGTDDALEKIKLLAENDNEIIRQNALKQLERIERNNAN